MDSNTICIYTLEKFDNCYEIVSWLSTSNHMFGRAIWDKLRESIFENFEIARVKRGQLQNFQKSRG